MLLTNFFDMDPIRFGQAKTLDDVARVRSIARGSER